MEVGAVGGGELGCGSCRGGALVGAEDGRFRGAQVVLRHPLLHRLTPLWPDFAAVREAVDLGREGSQVADGRLGRERRQVVLGEQRLEVRHEQGREALGQSVALAQCVEGADRPFGVGGGKAPRTVVQVLAERGQSKRRLRAGGKRGLVCEAVGDADARGDAVGGVAHVGDRFVEERLEDRLGHLRFARRLRAFFGFRVCFGFGAFQRLRTFFGLRPFFARRAFFACGTFAPRGASFAFFAPRARRASRGVVVLGVKELRIERELVPHLEVVAAGSEDARGLPADGRHVAQPPGERFLEGRVRLPIRERGRLERRVQQRRALVFTGRQRLQQRPGERGQAVRLD